MFEVVLSASLLKNKAFVQGAKKTLDAGTRNANARDMRFEIFQ